MILFENFAIVPITKCYDVLSYFQGIRRSKLNWEAIYSHFIRCATYGTPCKSSFLSVFGNKREITMIIKKNTSLCLHNIKFNSLTLILSTSRGSEQKPGCEHWHSCRTCWENTRLTGLWLKKRIDACLWCVYGKTRTTK